MTELLDFENGQIEAFSKLFFDKSCFNDLKFDRKTFESNLVNILMRSWVVSILFEWWCFSTKNPDKFYSNSKVMDESMTNRQYPSRRKEREKLGRKWWKNVYFCYLEKINLAASWFSWMNFFWERREN